MIEKIQEVYNALLVAFNGFPIYQNLAPQEAIEGDFIVFSVGIENVQMFLGAKFYEIQYSARVFIVAQNEQELSDGINYLIGVNQYHIMGLKNEFQDDLQKTVCTFTIMFNL